MSSSTQPPTQPPSTQTTLRTLDSVALFGEHDEVLIVHDGQIYRLRRTRQGKLILTK